MTTTAPTFDLHSPEFESTVREIMSLRGEQERISQRISFLIRTLPSGADLRPDYGPCTRCGHSWKGMLMWRAEAPRCCPRCGSSAWQTPPKRARARKPTDPPNPRWGKNRRTGLPTSKKNQAAQGTPEATARMREDPRSRGYTGPPQIAWGLTRPPRLADVAPSLVAREGVRFGNVSVPTGGIYDDEFEAIPGDGSIMEEEDSE